jgi:hypothetical protein
MMRADEGGRRQGGVCVAEVADLNWLVTAFTDRVPDVARAAVVSADGLPLACSRDFPPDRVDQLAAITSGLSGLTRGAARIFEGGPVVQSVVVMKQGLLMVRAVGHGAVLVVLAGADCDIGQVAYEMALFGEQAGPALSPAPHGLPPAGARPWPRRYTPGERPLRVRGGSDVAGLRFGEDPGDPDARPAGAVLDLIAEHRGLVLQGYRADGHQVRLLVLHDQHEVHGHVPFG